MKQTMALCLAILLLLSVTGCAAPVPNGDNGTQSTEETTTQGINAPDRNDVADDFSKIPRLSAIYANVTYQAMTGTCSWTYKRADGTFTGIQADSMHPLQAKEHMPCIKLVGGDSEAYLLFDQSPGKITVRYWESWDADPFDGSKPLTVEHASGVIQLNEQPAIYEVIAEWRGEEGGNIRYCFYTE